MENKKPIQSKISKITIYSAIIVGIVLLNLLFIFLASNETKTVGLLKTELSSIEKENKIITSSTDIYSQFDSEIVAISEVFPKEQTIPLFIQKLEELIRSVTDEYSFKFTSVTPIKENDRLFLPMTISMKTDLNRLLTFFAALEKFPYMSHVNLIVSKSPDGFTTSSEIQLNIKVYVQNPFIGE